MRLPLASAHIAVVALLGAQVAFGQESVEDQIRQRVAQYEAAYNAGDADAVAAIYAANGSHTYAFGVTHHGRPEIAAGPKGLFAGPLKGTRITLKPTRIRRVAGSVAVEEASFSLAGLRAPDGTGLPVVAGLFLAVYGKDGLQWFAEAVQCLVPPPVAPPQ